MEDDTIKLLKECNAGIKMGISSLDDVMSHVRSSELKNLLCQSRETHTKLGEDILINIMTRDKNRRLWQK